MHQQVREPTIRNDDVAHTRCIWFCIQRYSVILTRLDVLFVRALALCVWGGGGGVFKGDRYGRFWMHNGQSEGTIGRRGPSFLQRLTAAWVSSTSRLHLLG
eukprot:COSAG02_NODE_1799_length_10896_cov_8.648421_3_plen_101_part_00